MVTALRARYNLSGTLRLYVQRHHAMVSVTPVKEVAGYVLCSNSCVANLRSYREAVLIPTYFFDMLSLNKTSALA